MSAAYSCVEICLLCWFNDQSETTASEINANEMFEISAELIAALDDTHMRELVARLCRAELRARGLPESAVTAGGHQLAGDGGIDVRVEVREIGATLDFVPRPLTGLQVKQTKGFGPAAVREEMAPKGMIRPVLQELADAAGAYVIVSGAQSVADRGLGERRKAMRETTAKLQGAEGLTLDFYDGHRVSEWANQHPGIVLWVLEKLGRPHVGYRPCGHWCVAADDELIEDEAGRLEDRYANASEPLSLVAGIERLRDRLRQKPACVRLVGLSGTGKTRLAQALFDERVGAGALAPDLAVYTDIGDSPTPPVAEVLLRLIRDGRCAVLIVDNCPPDTHRSLAKELARSASGVSLLTIEYDIRDDLPEETEVYRLLPGSGDLIDTLLQRHAPRLSTIDRERLAEWSAGNTRLALALARQVGTGESLSKLSDVELFNRLLYQRQSRDRALLHTAEAAALVYSFNVETSDGEDAELPILAGLAGQTPADFFRYVEEMRRRDLVQRRGVWRAVLPQALAHHLARRALDSILPAGLYTLIADAPPRLLKSFTRELGHLHDSERAMAIAREWLAAGGRLGDYASLSDDERAMFRNLAPIDPPTTLRAIERSLPVLVDSVQTLDGELLDDVARLLHALAYEATDFPQAVDLLARLCTSTGEDAAPREHFRQLFWVGLSGTLAVTQQRLAVIDKLLLFDAESERLLGLEALSAMLNLDQRTTSHRFDFGARQRDFGWSPGTHDEMVNWLTSAQARLGQQAGGAGVVAERALQILVERFPGLWRSGWITDALEGSILAAASAGYWPESYLAVRRAKWRSARSHSPELKARLARLAERLAPQRLIDRVRVSVLSETYDPPDDVEDDNIGSSSAYHAADQRAEELGVEAAADPESLTVLLPELVTSRSPRIRSFGRGLGRETDDPAVLWEQLVAAFERASLEERTLGLLRGYLASVHQRRPEAARGFLDQAVGHSALGTVFPILQTAVPLDATAVRRLHASLLAGLATVTSFNELAYGGRPEMLASGQLVALVEAVAAHDGGWQVAAEILAMRFFPAPDRTPVDADLIGCGRRLLLRLPATEPPDEHSERLEFLVDGCLAGEGAADVARCFCRGVISTAGRSDASSWRYKRLIKKLLEVQPAVTLDELIESPADELDGSRWFFWDYSIGELLETVSKSVLLSWLRAGAPERFAILAAKLTLFRGSEADDQASLSSAAVTLITHAPNRASVLERLRLTPSHTMASGSIAAVFDERRKSLGRLRELEDPVVDAWVARADEDLLREAEAWRSVRSDRDERFE